MQKKQWGTGASSQGVNRRPSGCDVFDCETLECRFNTSFFPECVSIPLSYFRDPFCFSPTLTKLTPSNVVLPAFSGGVLSSATMPVFLGRTLKRN